MASSESYHYKEKVAAQRAFSIALWLVLVFSLAVGLNPSQALARCGVDDLNLLSVDVPKLSGLTREQLVLMPSVRYTYANGQLTTSFGLLTKPCSGPACHHLPDSNELLGEVSIIQDTSSCEALLSSDADHSRVDEHSRLLKSVATLLVEQMSESPNLRPPIL